MAQQYRHIIPANPENLICNHNLFDVHPFELSKEQVATLRAIVNSTLVANFKTFYGRYAGTEGNLKTEVVDVNLMEVPDPRRVTKTVAKKLQDAFAKLCQRDTRGMVEEEFMECRKSERIKKLAARPIGLPKELTMPDRRALDLAVFELLGVSNAVEREKLCDELYHETAKHFRQIRIIEVQKQEQRAGTEGGEFCTDELAADLWDSLPSDEKQPLVDWIAAQLKAGDRLTVDVPEGRANLPDASDMLDANTIFFQHSKGGKAGAPPLALPSRAHAEMVFTLARHNFHGMLPLPKSEKTAQTLQAGLMQRLVSISARANELARSRTGDEKRVTDLAHLLEFWLIHGKPRREPKEKE